MIDPQPSLAHTWPHSKSSSGSGWYSILPWTPLPGTWSSSTTLSSDHAASLPWLLVLYFNVLNLGLSHWCLACLSLLSSSSWTWSVFSPISLTLLDLLWACCGYFHPRPQEKRHLCPNLCCATRRLTSGWTALDSVFSLSLSRGCIRLSLGSLRIRKL